MKTTGRKFKCVGLNSIRNLAWVEYFHIGETYLELDDICDSGMLVLWDKDEEFPYPWNVESSQFELIK